MMYTKMRSRFNRLRIALERDGVTREHSSSILTHRPKFSSKNCLKVHFKEFLELTTVALTFLIGSLSCSFCTNYEHIFHFSI